jgi:hypothetical protein
MILAAIGVAALYMLFAWLAITILCEYLSSRKGYGMRWGLATGLIFPPGVIVWLVMPPKPDSDWKVLGAFGGKSIEDDEAVDPATQAPPATPTTPST